MGTTPRRCPTIHVLQSIESDRPASDRTPSLVVDFGAQYAQLIARRVRELKVHSEIVPHRITAAEVRSARRRRSSCRAARRASTSTARRRSTPAIYDLGVPVLGICYGAQLIAQQLGGTVGRGMRGEYGRARLTAPARSYAARRRARAAGRVDEPFRRRHRGPAGFVATASTADAPVAAFETRRRKIWGVQYHPEVAHTPHGMAVLERFLWRLAECDADVEMGSVLDEQVDAIRAQVGEPGCCVPCRAVSIRRSRRPSCIGPSAINSRASTSTPG